MPQLSSAAEVERLMVEYSFHEADMRTVLLKMYEPIERWIFGRLFFQPRPHTGDMVQMLDDLGIELPLDWRSSACDLTFTWR